MRSARTRRSRVRMRRLSGLSVNRMVPNVLTLLALCAGMTAMRFAMGGNFQAAVFAIIAAGIFDGLDGRRLRLVEHGPRLGCARRLEAQRRRLELIEFEPVPHRHPDERACVGPAQKLRAGDELQHFLNRAGLGFLRVERVQLSANSVESRVHKISLAV